MGSTVKQPPPKKAPIRRPRRRLVLIALLVGLTGFGAYGAARHLWAEYHFRAAQKELERHALPAAKSHLAECLAIWPDSTETNLLAARTARRLRDYDEADQLLSIYRKQGGEPEIVRLEHALALAQRGQLAGQESYLWVFVNEGDPDAALVLEALAQGYVSSYRWAEAINCLKRLLEFWPDRADVYLWRGWIYDNLHTRDLAEADYRRALKLDPDHEEAQLRLAENLVLAQSYDEAVDLLEKVRQRRPDDPPVLLSLARCRLEFNQPVEAERLLDRVLALDSRNAAAWTQKGKIAVKQGRLDEAEEWLRKSLAIAPWERESNYHLALCLQQRGKWEEAETRLARLKHIEADQDRLTELFGAMAKRPRDLSLRREAGVILLNNGQTKEGLRLLQSVLEEDAENRPTHAALADYYQRIGNRGLADLHHQQAQ